MRHGQATLGQTHRGVFAVKKLLIGVTGGYESNAFPWAAGPGMLFTPEPECQPIATDEHPIDLRINGQWTDDFDGSKDPDYLVEAEVYRPGKKPSILWKCQVRRSQLRCRPELIFEDLSESDE
jgi:hypothetical protein